MKTEEIIKLGQKLGLPFNRNDNFPDFLEKNIVYFNGSNGQSQRFGIDGKFTNDEILRAFGAALIQYGMRLKAMHINSVLSINGDHTSLPSEFYDE